MATSAPAPSIVDQAGLERLGRTVRERLGANRAVYRFPEERVELWAMGDFLGIEECARMIALIDDCAQPSTVYDLDYNSGYRTSYSGDVDHADPLVRKINRKIDDLLGIEPGWGEPIQGQRYAPGQEFQPHCDWFHYDTSYWRIEMPRGGQRSYTAMIFLNEVEEGGNTEFTDLGMVITPKPGALLTWNNADPKGVPNEATIHAGRPVVRGVKYILTKWYRTRQWP